MQREETEAEYKQKKLKTIDDLANRGITPSSNSSIYKSEMQKVEDEEKRELNKWNIEKEYLLKLKAKSSWTTKKSREK